jgi:cytolysin (calcineurin-like family phosphatase)
MKKFTLAMFIALLGSIGIQAQQTWTAPTLNFKTFADGDTVFFYNVSTGMFLTEGNAYGTQASLGTTGTPFAPLKQTDGTYLTHIAAIINLTY